MSKLKADFNDTRGFPYSDSEWFGTLFQEFVDEIKMSSLGRYLINSASNRSSYALI